MKRIHVTQHATERLQLRLHVEPETALRVAVKAWMKGKEYTKRAVIRKNRTEYFVSPAHVVKEMMGRAFVFDPSGSDIKLLTVI